MRILTRWLPGLSLLLLLVAGSAAQLAAAPAFPKIIRLPDGFRPEGVVVGRGAHIYAGSLEDGAIYQANLRTGEGEILVAGQPGRIAVGLSFDERSNYLFVSGGLTGSGTVYDAGSGALIREYQLAAPSSGPFINDVIVTREAAYFTNSFAPEIYRLALGPGGKIGATTRIETIALGGEFDFVPGPFVFNANGIVASADGKQLLVVNSTAQTLYHVDPATGAATRVDLGGAILPNGDGLVLLGNLLYVVQNTRNQIAVIRMNDGLTSGTVLETITDDAFRVPTTAALFGSRLYAVNARFGTPPLPNTEYEIVQVSR